MSKLEARWVKSQEVRAKSKRSAKGARPRFGRSTIWCHVRGGANQGGLHRQSLSMYQECAARRQCGLVVGSLRLSEQQTDAAGCVGAGAADVKHEGTAACEEHAGGGHVEVVVVGSFWAPQ
jgi:hypothetical protein